MRKLSKLFISISTTIAITTTQVICCASNASAVYPVSDVQVALIDVYDNQLTSSYVYNRMMLMNATFPEGMTWTNDQFYAWHGGIHAGGKGCAGFAYALSDSAFGTRPARMLTSIAFDSIRVGDVLRVKNDTHTVIVLENLGGGMMRIAEGNYGKKIHWGRILNLNDPKYDLNYVLTRYPTNHNPTPAPAPATPAPAAQTPAAPATPSAPTPSDSSNSTSNNSNSSKKSNNSSSKKSNNTNNSNNASAYSAPANNSASDPSANTTDSTDSIEVEDNQNFTDAKEAELRNISEINTKNTPRFTVVDTTIDPSEARAQAILHFDPKAKAQAILSYNPKATPCASFKPNENETSPLIAWISEVWD